MCVEKKTHKQPNDRHCEPRSGAAIQGLQKVLLGCFVARYLELNNLARCSGLPRRFAARNDGDGGERE